jgi:ribonuclease HI
MVGTVAVLFKHGEANPHAIVWLQLGNDKDHTVAEAELVGGILALSLIQNIQEIKRELMTIYTDSQGAQEKLCGRLHAMHAPAWACIR